MQFDHIVVHVDNNNQKIKALKETLNAQGYPFEPSQGRRNTQYSTSAINIGQEYIEIVRLLKRNARSWMPYWVRRYENGERGAFCIFIEIEDVERTAVALKRAGVKMGGPFVLNYPGFLGLLHVESPYFIYFMPNFPGSSLQLALMQYKKKNGRETFQAGMLPNAIENGINGIRRVEVALPQLAESMEDLQKIFPDLQSENGVWSTQLEKARFLFSQSADEDTHVRLSTITSQRVYVGKRSQIDNVELITLGG